MTNVTDFSGDEELLNQFLDYANECCGEMRGFLTELKAGGSENDLVDQIYTGSHNLKGMSGSFGFSLLTDVAGFLCQYLKQKRAAADIDLIESHLKAFDAILTHKIVGDGGERGAKLKDRLQDKVNDALDLL